MPRQLIGVFVASLVIAACSDEKPDQQLVQSEPQAAARDQRQTQDVRRQRTLGQNESERIYNQGSLR